MQQGSPEQAAIEAVAVCRAQKNDVRPLGRREKHGKLHVCRHAGSCLLGRGLGCRILHNGTNSALAQYLSYWWAGDACTARLRMLLLQSVSI